MFCKGLGHNTHASVRPNHSTPNDENGCPELTQCEKNLEAKFGLHGGCCQFNRPHVSWASGRSRSEHTTRFGRKPPETGEVSHLLLPVTLGKSCRFLPLDLRPVTAGKGVTGLPDVATLAAARSASAFSLGCTRRHSPNGFLRVFRDCAELRPGSHLPRCQLCSVAPRWPRFTSFYQL